MYKLPQLIKSRRKQLGMTQVQLAHLSEVSLPTIQNVESDESNLSYDILQKLLFSLQIEMDFKLKIVDWQSLIDIGIPISTLSKNIRTKNIVQTLNTQVPLVPSYDSREGEALLAYIWSLKSHFNNIYKQLTPLVKVKMEKIFKSQEFLSNSKLIQLKRICVDHISKWLVP